MFLTFITFLPFFGAVCLVFMPKENASAIKQTALAVAVADFLLSLLLWTNFDNTTHKMQFGLNIPWIEQWGINYHIGLDGISLLLYVMTTFLTMICVIASWDVKKHIREYMIAMLSLSTGMLGVFIALDLFMFYVFWEFQLVPMYIIVGVWGGPRRIYASIKFFLFTAVGSLLMLIAILWIYFHIQQTTGVATADILYITEHLDVSLDASKWLWLAFFLAFAIKVPMFPFHTWLPDAHVEAPTAGSVILAGVLLKMGTYGFLRFNLPFFPQASYEFVPMVAWLSIIGIIYGALVAMVQEDLKKLVAYSSVSHLGFIMLGIFALNPYGIQGALIQNINHGISTSALFLLVGIVYDRRHTRLISEFGGLAKIMPKYTVCFMIVALSSIGLPGMNGFVGEFLVLLGIFQVNGLWAACATSGVILAACYILWMFQRVMFLELKNPKNMDMKDMNTREMITIAPLIVLIFWIGLYPNTFMKTFDASVNHLVSKVNPDNFRPHQEQHKDSHGKHARLVTSTEMASLNQRLQMPKKDLIKE